MRRAITMPVVRQHRSASGVLSEPRQSTLGPASSSPFFPVRLGQADATSGSGPVAIPTCDMIWKNFPFCVRSTFARRFKCNSREFLSR